MKLSLIVSFAMVAVAPFIGRWRANVWLKKHMQRKQTENISARLVRTTQVL
jgi:hypothetical protein